ncbi:DUF5819 family protein [Streptomyces adustus]|uniref:DUF5819 family protein n=1 Tax=Streptomyces adustus TaxID=1609272 RepID=UPI0035DAE295
MDAYGARDAAGGGGSASPEPGTPPAQGTGVTVRGTGETDAAAAGREPTEPEHADPAEPTEPEHADPAEPTEPERVTEMDDVTIGPPPEPRTDVAALSPRYQIAAALALAVVAVTVCVHLGMVFMHVAPSNTVTKKHGKAIEEWIYPEFEQNWKLFAPNPLQQNIAVQARARVRTAAGEIRTTDWYDLSAEDGRAIDGNPLPSHVDQNELRRAWDFFTATHDADNRPVGLRGSLSESYLRRIVELRLDRDGAAGQSGTVDSVQVRSATTNVRPPAWSGERISLKPMYRVLSWWSVPADEAEGATK